MARYLFYPGCSIQRSARPYLDSLNAVCDALGLELTEVDDWNCCGATEYASVNGRAAHALVARNLALAQKASNGTRTLVAACSACYLNLVKTNHYMGEDADLSKRVNTALEAGGLKYDPGSLLVRHLLDVICSDVGLKEIQTRVVRPLKGLRVAPYYGCLVSRPDPEGRFDSKEYPTALDRLLKALGAEVVDYPLKTHCCGGHMTQINPPTAYELIRRLLCAAHEFQSDIIAALCPMCQLNLDAFQADTNRHFRTNYQIPVLYFTQLMGVAFGLEPQALGLGREFVNSRDALARIGVVVHAVPDEDEEPPAARHKEEPLPMPRMTTDEEAGE